MKAMIVDDSRTIRMMLRKFLTAEGFDTLVEAGDGHEALTKLAEAGPVDLVVVDWNMPVMDGFDFITKLRAISAFDKVRVIVLSTESAAAKIDRAISAGANGYLNKPFKAELLREKLDSLGFEKPSA